MCEPAGGDPPLYEGEATLAQRVGPEAVMQSDRHVALRLLRGIVPSVEAALAGLHNQGLLASHKLVHRVPKSGWWPATWHATFSATAKRSCW